MRQRSHSTKKQRGRPLKLDLKTIILQQALADSQGLHRLKQNPGTQYQLNK